MSQLLPKRPRPLPVLLGICASWLLACDSGLEVRGLVDRLVGETVMIALVDGADGLGTDVRLTDAEGAVVSDMGLLKVTRNGDKRVSIVIPRDVAAGPASLAISDGADRTFDVPLTITRIAAIYRDGGAIITPLPPSSLRPIAISGTADGGDTRRLSLSPSGNLLTTLTGGALQLISVGRNATTVANDTFGEALGVTTLDSGVIVATKRSLVVLSWARNTGLLRRGTFPLVDTRRVAVTPDNTKAVALSSCDSDSDSSVDADCLTLIDLEASSPKAGPAVVVDKQIGANWAGLRADGSAAVVFDKEQITVVDFTQTPPAVQTNSWDLCWPSAPAPSPFGAEVVGLDRTTIDIEGQATDMFAVAERTRRIVCTLGFKQQTLRAVSSRVIDQAPLGLAFGRRSQLYIATQTGLLTTDVADARLPTAAVPDIKLDAFVELDAQR